MSDFRRPMQPHAVRISLLPLVCFLLVPALGCGKPIRPGFAAVTGEVTFEDKPIPQGWIQFEPTGSKMPPESVRIEDGRDRGVVRAGASRVRIEAARGTGKISEISGQEIEESYIPSRYNKKTELEANVLEHQANGFDFHLK